MTELPSGVQRTIEAVRAQWDPQYDVVVNHFVPWTALRKPLRESRIAVVSSAGAYLAGAQEPFDLSDPHGDPTFREIPAETPPRALSIAHEHYDHALADEDANVVFPLERLRTLAEAGEIGGLAPVAYSFSGFVTRQLPLAADHGPEVAKRLQAAAADAALLVAV
ncbi:MAG: glycine/sarcosine/betaine reductase selenoprotein B family protein [Anaeromyxobacteraceae bacterium]